jgi:O-antigen/teichoic acid export membrane protein
MPLVLNEIAGVALISIDRVMLKWILDDYAVVGIYTIGYSLAIQVSVFMSASLSESFVPVANRLYETEGPASVRALKQKILLPLTYVSLGIAAAIWSTGSDVLHAVSGPDKWASGPIFAWAGTLFALYPLIDISGYGLLLHKRTVTVFKLTLGAALINIALNLAFIPAYGPMGAVYSTVISYALLGGAVCALCPRELLRLPDARSLLTAGGAVVLYLGTLEATGLFGLTAVWPRLLVAFGLWVLTYVLPVLVLDGRLRNALLGWPVLRRLRR